MVLVRLFTFNLTNNGIDKLSTGMPGHSLGKFLIVNTRKRLPAAPTVKERGFKRAIMHLLQQCSIKRLGNPLLRLMSKLFVFGLGGYRAMD
jgi:hypothetical protein